MFASQLLQMTNITKIDWLFFEYIIMSTTATTCAICPILRDCAEFSGTHCLLCHAKIRDESEDDYGYAESKMLLTKNNGTTEKRKITTPYLYLKTETWIDHTSMNCDIYVICTDMTYPSVVTLYTSREICSKYNISMATLEALREVIPRPKDADPQYKHVIYSLFNVDLDIKNVVVEYLRVKKYTKIAMNTDN